MVGCAGEPQVREVPVTVEVPKEVVKEVPVTVQVPMEALDPLIVGNLNVFTGSLSEFGPPLRNSMNWLPTTSTGPGASEARLWSLSAAILR